MGGKRTQSGRDEYVSSQLVSRSILQWGDWGGINNTGIREYSYGNTRGCFSTSIAEAAMRLGR